MSRRARFAVKPRASFWCGQEYGERGHPMVVDVRAEYDFRIEQSIRVVLSTRIFESEGGRWEVGARIDREAALRRFMIRVEGIEQRRKGHPTGVVNDVMFEAFLEVVAGEAA